MILYTKFWPEGIVQIPFVDLQIQYKFLRKKINESLQKVCSSSSFIKGPFLEQFEKDFAKFVGTKYCIGVASGTDALHLGLRVLDVKKGDEIILPAFTFVATAYAILYAGAKPIFVDIDPLTFNIDVNKIEQKITKNTKAIIPVHLYGQPAEMDKILSLAKKYKLFILEDAAQAHGAIYKDKKVGTFGNLAAFSFYPGKNLGAYGDGGAIVTNSAKFYKRLLRLREYGATSKYVFDEIGLNSRLDSLQAAILSIKLQYLKNWNKKRRKVAQNYNKMFLNLKDITTPYENKNLYHVYHLYTVQTSKRDQLRFFLQSKGIQTGIHYPIPLHLQKSLKNLSYKRGDFPIAEKLSSQILSLPIYPELTLTQQDYIIKSIKKFFDKGAKK